MNNLSPRISGAIAPLVATGCILGALLQGCAYFNTYYNAKTAYANARRDHTKIIANRVDSTAQLPSAVMSSYDRAIEKSAKVMEVYPRSVDWHDDAVFLMGKAQFYKGELLPAIRRFKQLQREFPNSPFLPESYLFLGKAYLENENLTDAEETFQFILDRFPELNTKEEVTLLLAQVAIQREGKTQAIELLKKTLASVKTPDKKLDIISQIAGLYMDLRQYDQAISLLKSAPRKKEFPERMYRVDIALLKCYLHKHDFQKALSLANAMHETKRYIPYLAEIRFYKGKSLNELGQIEKAIETLMLLTHDNIEAEWQGKAWLELALIYQHKLGDFERALECYESAVGLLTSEDDREFARTRQDAIINALSLSDTAATLVRDTADSVDRISELRYKLGETYWLRLDEPDSALAQFATITADSAADSISVMKALFARAWIYKSMKKDTALADSLFALVTQRYPATEYAKSAQASLGEDVTIMTRRDSAYVAFRKAEKLYTHDNSALAASRAYLAIANTYPDLDIAPQSLYAAGWLCDNALDKNVTARKIYKKLCDEYPQSTYCIDEAQPRLTVVADTLNALKARKRANALGDAGEHSEGGREVSKQHEADAGKSGQANENKSRQTEAPDARHHYEQE